MPDPHNNPDKPATENSSQNPSFIQKLNAFVEHPRTPGGEPSSWVPVRNHLTYEVSKVFTPVGKFFRKK